jgi:hypothetical protein
MGRATFRFSHRRTGLRNPCWVREQKMLSGPEAENWLQTSVSSIHEYTGAQTHIKDASTKLSRNVVRFSLTGW